MPHAGINYCGEEQYGEDPYLEAEAASASAQAENEYNEMINKMGNDYIQSLPEVIWQSPSMSDVAKAFIAGFEAREKHS